jgi:hypothetical protein
VWLKNATSVTIELIEGKGRPASISALGAACILARSRHSLPDGRISVGSLEKNENDKKCLECARVP